MRRFVVTLAALLCFAFSAIAEPWRVFDNAGLFSVEEIQIIEHAITGFQRETNMDFAVLTMTDYFGKNNSWDIAKAFYESNNFGFGNQASGIIYFFHLIDGMLYANYGMCGEMSTAWGSESNSTASTACRQLVFDGKYKDAVLQLIESATEAIKETMERDKEG